MLMLWMLLFSLSHFSTGESSRLSISNNVKGFPQKKNNVKEARVPAMYVFGDSLNDVGNAAPLGLFPPYGVDFPVRPRTGRSSNGKVFPDFVADYVGLPYPPAYKSGTPSDVGSNYAYAGCGILPEPGSTGGCWTLEDQVDRFKETVESELQHKFKGTYKLSQHLADSLFIVWAGSNDYILSYFQDKMPEYDSEQFAQLLIDTMSHKLQMLYELGARKVLVMELGPIGCTPQYRGNHDATWCDESKNNNVTIFNGKLASMIETLDLALPDSHFSIGKIYALSDDAFKNPSKYGFTNVSQSCCLTIGGMAGDIICWPCYSDSEPCIRGNTSEYLFWDGVHPSEASISIMATQCINGSSVCVPMNLEELIQVKAKPSDFLTQI